MEVRSSGSTFSVRVTVFSVTVTECDGLTCLASVSDAEKLGLVVTRDGGISVGVSGQEGELFGHIVRLHFCSTL